MKEDYQKALKKLSLFFLSNPVPFNGQSYQKQKGLELVTSCSSGWETNSQNFFATYVLSEQVWWCNIKQFLSFPKITPACLCKPIHDIIDYSISVCPLESGKCGKEGGKLQKFEYLATKRAF